MVDMIFKEEVPIKAHSEISIMVRYQDETNFMAFSWLGYGGESY